MAYFWNDLPKPFFCLAPMADVTDPAFRRMFAKYGKPDVLWTEFVSANGLMSPGRDILKEDLRYEEEERPIVAQLFTADPDAMRGAARLVAELDFDGLDINMGCPDKAIEKQGAGAALMKNTDAARAVIRAAKEGVADGGKDIPVSVKTRLGWNKVEIDTWIPALLEEGLAALTVHARTRKEMSLVPAHWQYVAEVVRMRDKLAPETHIIGNGDVMTLVEGRARADETGCDGIMVGRGAFGAPWFFSGRAPETLEERLNIMVEHTRLFEELCGTTKPFALMKKHFKAYVHGFDGAKELRTRLMDETQNTQDVERIAGEWIKNKDMR